MTDSADDPPMLPPHLRTGDPMCKAMPTNGMCAGAAECRENREAGNWDSHGQSTVNGMVWSKLSGRFAEISTR